MSQPATELPERLRALILICGGDPALEGLGLDQRALDIVTDGLPLAEVFEIEALADRRKPCPPTP